MADQAPLKFIFYIAATSQKVWEGFVSRESSRIIFSGAELQADFKPRGSLAWVGAGPDDKPMTYVQGKVLRFDGVLRTEWKMLHPWPGACFTCSENRIQPEVKLCNILHAP